MMMVRRSVEVQATKKIKHTWNSMEVNGHSRQTRVRLPVANPPAKRVFSRDAAVREVAIQLVVSGGGNLHFSLHHLYEAVVLFLHEQIIRKVLTCSVFSYLVLTFPTSLVSDVVAVAVDILVH